MGRVRAPAAPAAASAAVNLAARRAVATLRLRSRRVTTALLRLVAFVALFPIVWLLQRLAPDDPGALWRRDLLPAAPQFQNYAIAWTKGGFRVFLPNSLLYSSVTRRGDPVRREHGRLRAGADRVPRPRDAMFLILAIMIVPLPASFVALYKLLVDLGLANTRLGYILALMAGGLPISIFILRGFFIRQPKELEDAAVLDGCSAFDVYWRVMLPLARPGLAAVAVIQFLHAWNEYLLALVMFNTESLMPVQRGLTKFVSSDTPEQHILLAATAMAVLPVIVLYAFAQRSIIQGIMDGAVKG